MAEDPSVSPGVPTSGSPGSREAARIWLVPVSGVKGKQHHSLAGAPGHYGPDICRVFRDTSLKAMARAFSRTFSQGSASALLCGPITLPLVDVLFQLKVKVGGN